jgi:hypothetical protein
LCTRVREPTRLSRQRRLIRRPDNVRSHPKVNLFQRLSPIPSKKLHSFFYEQKPSSFTSGIWFHLLLGKNLDIEWG